VILHLGTSDILFEHRFNDKPIIGLFFDCASEFLFILYMDGEAELFSANMGNLNPIFERWGKIMNEMMKTAKDKNLPISLEQINHEKQKIISASFNFERSMNLKDNHLNLMEYLTDYKNCYIDFNNYNEFIKTKIHKVTARGGLVEYNLKFLTNCFKSVHIDYANLNQRAYNSISQFRAKDIYGEDKNLREKEKLAAKTPDLNIANYAGDWSKFVSD
jgi:hypothetical protein